jgi:hypothetical protein
MKHRHAAVQRSRLQLAAALAATSCPGLLLASQAPVLRCYPGGQIFDYRWHLLRLVLAKTPGPSPALEIHDGQPISQSRATRQLAAGELDVLALGTNAERERDLLPIRFDISFGMVGMRLLLIRREDQARIARMDSTDMRNSLVFGLNVDWADLPILRANGFKVVTATGYETLFAMLSQHRFDAFTRGLNEAHRELQRFHDTYPNLVIERTKALYFSYPIYFWVNRERADLAQQIDQGLKVALADGSLRRLFERFYAGDIRFLKQFPHEVILLRSNALPPGYVEPDTSWWWPRRTQTSR